jgi:hypothetical protein
MQPSTTSNRIRDILLLIFSILGITGLIGWGISSAIVGLTKKSIVITSNPVATIFDILGMFLCAALLLPLLILCIRKLRGKEIRVVSIPPIKLWQVAGLLIAWVSMIILGMVLSNLFKWGWIVATPLYLLGIATPIAGLAWIAAGGLPTGCIRRLWATFGIGMIGSTSLAMLVEYALVAIAALAGGMIAFANPELRTILEQIKNQVTNSGDVQSLITTLSPYLTNPLVLVLALLFTAVIAPIIEETLKPFALWFLGRRLSSPAEGFALGALCGAGFALLEGTLAASGMAEMLGIGVAVRMASSLMHITASGIMGWGIASALCKKRYARLVGAFILSTSIHGLWNGSVVLAVFGALRTTVQGITNPDMLGISLVLLGIVILGASFVTIIILLPVFNCRLRPVRQTAASSVRSDIIAPLEN